MSQKQVDKKTEITIRTIEHLKGSNNLFKEFVQIAYNYQRASLKLAEEGKKLADALQRISNVQQLDLRDGIAKLADIHRNVEIKREAVCKAIQDDLTMAITKAAKPFDVEIAGFEGDHKRVLANSRAQIAKMEANSKKAGKKGGAALQESIRELDATIKEAERVKAEKLRNALILERKKYCSFVSMWAPVIAAEIDLAAEMQRMKESQTYFSNLAASTNNIPTDAESLISVQAQERTYVQIQGGGDDYGSDYSQPPYGGGGGYSSGGGGYSDNSSYGGGYSDTSYGGGDYYSGNQGYGGGYSSGGLGTATALYDFAGDQPSDLPFYAGEVITITVEDDGSGW